MVKNRALKRDARVFKAFANITYPQARKLLIGPAGQGSRPTAPDYRFEFGTDASGKPVVFTPVTDHSLFISGAPGSGKTVFLNALAADAVQAMDVYFSNTAFPSEEVHTPESVRAATTHQETEDMLDGVVHEITCRQRLCQEANVGGIAELPQPLRPILIILDEFRWLTHDDSYAIKTGERAQEGRSQRDRIAVAVAKIAREGRPAGVSLVVSAQDPDLHWLPGPENITVTMSQLVLGCSDYGFPRLTSGLHDSALRSLRPRRQQGVFAPLSGTGGLVDIASFPHVSFS